MIEVLSCGLPNRRDKRMAGSGMMISTDALKPITMMALLTGGLWVAPAIAQSDQVQAAPVEAAVNAKADRGRSAFHPVMLPKQAKSYYQAYAGVDNLRVRSTASGNLIRFSYRVTDAERAKILAEKNATPYMFGQRSQALLQIPVMDKIGQLRQTGKPVVGQDYWMVFSNKGNFVKAGDRVNVIVGSFHIDGLLVE
jgi:hypothetical protein